MKPPIGMTDDPVGMMMVSSMNEDQSNTVSLRPEGDWTAIEAGVTICVW